MKKSQIIFIILILIIALVVGLRVYYEANSYSSSPKEAIEKRFTKEVDEFIILYKIEKRGLGIVISKDKKMYAFHIEYNERYGSRVKEISTGIDLDKIESTNLLYNTLYFTDNTTVVYGITSAPNVQDIYINGLKGRMIDFGFYFDNYIEYGEGKKFWYIEVNNIIEPEIFLLKDYENNIIEKYIK